MMRKGPLPKKLIDTTWSPGLAYSIGLIATDGCLSRSSYLIDLTSKDKEQLYNFNKALEINIKIGTKLSGSGNISWRIQLKNKLFYEFLISVGLTPAKSKTLCIIKIPDVLYFDFLRGCFDGDGSFYSYQDPRWKSSYMFYVVFSSASPSFLNWIQTKNAELISIKGHITTDKHKNTYQLKYAKKEARLLITNMYKNNKCVALKRKRLKIEKTLATMSL